MSLYGERTRRAGRLGRRALRPAAAGHELIAAASAEIAPITARIWGGIPAKDLAAAGRVLALVTERASAELAALTA